MKMNFKLVLLFTSVMLFGCSDETDVHDSAATIEETTTVSKVELEAETDAIVPQWKNQDGSTTRISGVEICSKDVPKDAQHQDCSFGGSAIYFYAEGENFVGLNKNSLSIKRLEVAGKDIRQTRSLEDNFKLGSFPKVSDDGNFVTWSVSIPSGFHSPRNALQIKGSIEALKSEELLSAESSEVKYDSFSDFTLGPITVKGTEIKPVQKSEIKDEELLKKLTELDLDKITVKDAERIAEEMGESLALVMQSLFGSFFNAPSGVEGGELQLQLHGEFVAVERIEVYSNGKKLSSKGYSYTDTQRSSLFEKPTGPTIVVKVFYWKDPTSVQMVFDL